MLLFLLSSSIEGAEPGPALKPFNAAEWLGIAKGLQVEPKMIAATDGSGSTFGLEYRFQKELQRGVLSGKTDLSFSLHSEGLIGADTDVNYNKLLTHGLRLSILDIFPRKDIEDTNRIAEHQRLVRTINYKYYHPWLELAKEKPNDTTELKRAELFDAARTELEPFGELKVGGPENDQWLVQDERGQREGFVNVLYDRVVKRRIVYLAADLNADAETDDRFDDLQLVGSVGARAKFDVPQLDFIFEKLRHGGGPPKNFLNRKGGPYVWGGIGLVDPSNNDRRRAVAREDDVFPRAHFGLFYRTEVFSMDAEKAVGLELTWRYYHEFSAPRGIRDENLDRTSYVRVTLLFPKNLFVEYTSGKLPLDVESSETVMGGWRYNF
jgi:hypothetical protein